MLTHPQSSKVIIILTVSVAGGLILWGGLRPRSLSEQMHEKADSILRCLNLRSSPCLASLEWKQSLTDLRIDRKVAERVIERTLFENLDGIVEGTVEKTMSSPSLLMVSCLTRTKNGREVPLQLVVSIEKGKPIVPNITGTSLLYHSRANHLVGASSRLDAQTKIEAWLAMARKDRAAFEGLGLKGVYFNAQDGYLTWEEYAASLQHRLERVRSRASANATQPGF